jgi:hypothetical protein
MLLFFHVKERKKMMNHGENNINKPSDVSPAAHTLLFPQQHSVALYTFLSILLRMKNELGLEAMLEYMAKYLTAIDSHNPKIAAAVGKALNAIPVAIIFHELTKYDKTG